MCAYSCGDVKVQKASIEVAAKVEHQMQLMDHMKQRLDVQDAVDLLVSLLNAFTSVYHKV